jgi:type IV secretion system protein VirB10
VVPAPDGLVLRPAAHANDASGAVGTSDAAGLVNDLEPAQRIDSMIVAPTAAIGEGALAGYESDRPTLRPLVVSHSGAGLQQALERSSLDAADATRLTSRAMVLARGAYIGCVLETQLISNIAGFVSCIVSDNVYSDDGHVLLIERGSHVTGEYRSDSRQGDTRLFVLWNRIKTVHGVLIDIDSPGGDAVGGQGLPGYVDHHWWERIGAAFLLSTFQDAMAIVMARQSGSASGAGTTINTSPSNTAAAAQDLSKAVLDSTINIPPTIYKNRGELVTIYVARDLRFDSVYVLR